jgi:hypothetical protein
LKGRKTAKPGRVISPNPPYKGLDITGLESGSLALDPTTQKVFEVPRARDSFDSSRRQSPGSRRGFVFHASSISFSIFENKSSTGLMFA